MVVGSEDHTMILINQIQGQGENLVGARHCVDKSSLSLSKMGREQGMLTKVYDDYTE